MVEVTKGLLDVPNKKKNATAAPECTVALYAEYYKREESSANCPRKRKMRAAFGDVYSARGMPRASVTIEPVRI